MFKFVKCLAIIQQWTIFRVYGPKARYHKSTIACNISAGSHYISKVSQLFYIVYFAWRFKVTACWMYTWIVGCHLSVHLNWKWLFCYSILSTSVCLNTFIIVWNIGVWKPRIQVLCIILCWGMKVISVWYWTLEDIICSCSSLQSGILYLEEHWDVRFPLELKYHTLQC